MSFAHYMTFTYINSQELYLPTSMGKMKLDINSKMGLVNCWVSIPGWEAIDSKELLEKREYLSSGGWLLVHYPWSSIWHHFQEHGDPSTNWISWVVLPKTEVKDWEWIWSRDISNLMKFSQIKEESRMDSPIFQDKVSANVDTNAF